MALVIVDLPHPNSDLARSLLQSMSQADAQSIMALYERGRLGPQRLGGIPCDAIADYFHIDRGLALTLYHRAKSLIELGAVCPTCLGTGHVR